MKLDLIVTNEQALQSLSLVKLADSQLAWDLSESLEEVQKALKKFGEKRDELVQKFGKPVEGEKDKYEMKDPEPFKKELEGLLSVDVKITFPKITLASLNGVSISPSDLMAWKALKIITKS